MGQPLPAGHGSVTVEILHQHWWPAGPCDSVEEHVEKITGYFRFLPGAARLRSLFFITLGGPQAHGHSLPVTARKQRWPC
ncbi:MAG: hypothetical protein ABSH09_31815 [Bryobacteraceae bacterium]